MRKLLISFLSVLPFVMLSCDDDDEDPMPPLRMEFVETITDSKSIVEYILTDEGVRLTPSSPITASRPDTTYRCVCQYAMMDGVCHVYDLRAIFSKKPVHISETDTMWTDPLGVNSVWKTSRYVNMSLALLTTGQGSHVYSFCEDTIMTNSLGSKTAFCTLSHHRVGKDPESYTQDVYLSMPVYDYVSSGIDSVAVSIHTYSGWKQYQFKL